MLSDENRALLAHARMRLPELLTQPEVRAAMPSSERFAHVVAGRSSIEIVERAMDAYADRPALGWRSREALRQLDRHDDALPAFVTLTYRELWRRVSATASGLHRLGIGPGSMIILVGFATVEHVVVELACHYLGAVSVPLAKDISAADFESITRQCEAIAVCCSVEQVVTIASAARSCPSIATFVVFDHAAGDDREHEAIARARAAFAGGSRELHLLLDIEREGASQVIRPYVPNPDDDPLITMVYTSGSTGAPKGAMFREASWCARWRSLPFPELLELPMVSVVFLPQNHMGGRNAVANNLKLGGVAYFTHRSDMSTYFEDVRSVRPTYLHLVPRISEAVYQQFQSELARGRGEDEIVDAMRRTHLGDRMLLALTASAPTAPEVLAFIKRCFQIPVVNVFAGTEYGQLFVDGRLNRKNVKAFKLVSVPELGYHDTDQPFPRGELYVKTARGIAAYFKNEAATRALTDGDGYIRTGDIFEQRADDEMVWIDRRNNVVKLAQGEFVNLWRLEALFSAGSRFIHQIYMHGDSTRSYLLAVVVVHADVPRSDAHTVVQAELQRIASEHQLHAFEVPRELVVAEEPFSVANGLLTSLGKPARPQIKQRYGAHLDVLAARIDASQHLADDAALPIETRTWRAFAAALGRDIGALDPERSFREHGGDSLAAAKVCSFFDDALRISVPVGRLLAQHARLGELVPSIVQQALEARETRPPTTFDRIHASSPGFVMQRDLRVSRFTEVVPATRAAPDRGDVLLTGATGFLGRFLCLELLERAAATGRVVRVLMRARSESEALRRLHDVFRPGSALHARFATLAEHHLAVGLGDLERPRLGLAPDAYDVLADTVAAIVHAGALVNHALPYTRLFDANVAGTAALLALAARGQRKPFTLISTNSVSLALLGDRDHARETDDTRTLGDHWPIDSARRANGYQLSKWASEVLAQDAADSLGIPVSVMRCCLILPPSRHRGQVNRDDFMTRLVCSCVATGVYPRSLYDDSAPAHLDGLPVDYMAAAITAISAEAEPGYRVYHVNNVRRGDGMSLDSLLARAATRYSLERIDDHATWFARFEARLRSLPPSMQTGSSLPIIEQWRQPLQSSVRHKVDASGFVARTRALQLDGEAVWGLDLDYFDRYLDDLASEGLIPSR